jgi:hypothetical protein
MKPKTPQAMRHLIQQFRLNLPFAITEQELSAEICSYGGPQKLLEYLDMELTQLEQRINKAEVPTLADIHKLSKASKKIYNILKENNLEEDVIK